MSFRPSPSPIDDATLTSLLDRALGTGDLTPSQRRRHLALLAQHIERLEQQEASYQNVGERQRLVAGALLVLTAAVALSLWWLLASPTHPEVEAAADILAPPAPGSGRHLLITGESTQPVVGQTRRWTVEIWERTLADGLHQLAASATDSSGRSLAQYVQSGDAWTLHDGLEVDHGRGTPLGLPPTLATALATPGSLREVLLASDPDNVQIRQSGNQHILTITISPSATDRATLARELELEAEAVKALILTVRFVPSEQRLVSWEAAALDVHQNQHPLFAYRFVVWDVMAADAVPDASFTLGPATPSPTLDLPPVLSLPSGTFTRSSQHQENGAVRAIYVGPGTRVVQITVLPSSNQPLDLPGPDVQVLRTTAGDVQWSSGDTAESWPRLALWDDGRYRYDLSVLTAPPNGWTLADLSTIAEALAAWSGAIGQ